MRKSIMTMFLLLSCFALQVMAQEESKGIAFEKDGTLFRQAVQKALSQQKLIFLDCYTSWCGPCKMMAKNVFPLEEVGNFMNPKYVSIKIDMEKGEGPELQKKLQVSAYPTFIIFNSGGQEIGRFVGGCKADEFIEKVKQHSIDNGSAEMDQRFANGDRDEAFLYEYLNTLGASYKRDQCSVVAEALLEGKEKTFTEDQKLTDVFMRHMANPFCPAFVQSAKNQKKLAKAVGEDRAAAKILNVFTAYQKKLVIEENGTVRLDQENMDKWLELMADCKVEKNTQSHLRLSTLMNYYEKKADWNAYVGCVQEYGKDMDISDLMLAKWCTPVVRQCKDAAPREAVKVLLQQRLDDLKSGKRAPQTKQGNMLLSGNMERAFQMLIDVLDGKEIR